MIHRPAATAVLAPVVAVGLLAALAPSAAAAPGPPGLRCGTPVGGLVTCASRTPGETAFTVPAGVRALHVRLVGGGGGRGSSQYFAFDERRQDGLQWSTVPTPGGLGAELQGDLSVGAGERVYLVVGGRGRDGGHLPTEAQTGLGGSNGGGAAGGLSDPSIRGGGGGGATDLRVGADGLANRVMVAAGGGGAGTGSWFGARGADHDATAVADTRPARCGGQSGHTRLAGIGTFPGLPGGFGVGGAGATGSFTYPEDPSTYVFAAGGGGGGYGGGGGGAVGTDRDTLFLGAAGCGGGGGSSLFKQRYAVRGSASTLYGTSAPASVTLTYQLPGS